MAIIGVAVLAAIALAASFTEPQVAYVPTVLTVLGALGAGSAVAGFLLYASGHQASESAPEPKSPKDEPRLRGVRSREAHSARGIAVGRRTFLILSSSAAIAGLAAGGVGRTLASEGVLGESNPAVPKELPDPSASGGEAGSNETLPEPPPRRRWTCPVCRP